MNPARLRLILLCSGAVLLAAAGVLFLIPAQPAQAQCTTPSSCKTCHEIQGQMPVSEQGLWHKQHTLFDFCETCHGGDRNAATADLAHTGMRIGYTEISTTCKSCHPSELETCVRTYADELGLSESSVGGILDVASSGPADAAALIAEIQSGTLTGPALPEAAAAAPSENAPVAAETANSGALNTVLWFVLGGVAAGASGYIILNERRLKAGNQPTLAVLSRLAAALRRENWSPYAAGVLLGFTGILSVLIGQHLLSAAGPLATITSLLVHAADPTAADGSLYFRFVVPPAVDWSVMLFLGIFLGGMLGALTSRTWKLRWNDDPVWRKVFGRAPWKRIVLGFAGAVLLQYGASLAGGCTSGLAISGGMLLTPSAFLFMAGMFVSGIITVWIVFRRKY